MALLCGIINSKTTPMQNLFLQFLEATGMSQAECARRLGYTRQYINHIAKNGCSQSQLQFLALQLGYTVSVDVKLTVIKTANNEQYF